MNKCLKITLSLQLKKGFLQNVIQKQARKFELEGLVKLEGPETIQIIVCGEKDRVDAFVDGLQSESAKAVIRDIEIEPFLKDKDYRGVFRIIE